jgi:hypothetical protein
MSPDQGVVIMVTILGIGFYGASAIIASLAMQSDLDDAFWWPIHAVKSLLKSLYRALFTEWKV